MVGANAGAMGANLLHLDPPAHTRIRSLVTKGASGRAVATKHRETDGRSAGRVDDAVWRERG